MAMLAPKPFSLAHLSEIKARYSILDGESGAILIVAFAGEYRFGSAGNPDAQFMYAMADAGVIAAAPTSVIFDFSQLSYRWGDMIEMVYNATEHVVGSEPLFAVIVGDGCREGLRTLELGETSTEPASTIPWLHEDLQSAYDYLNGR